MAIMSALTLDIGRKWGDVAVPVQWQCARAVLDAQPHDPRLFWHELPKGHSKSTDTAAMSITWLIKQAQPGAEGYVVSSDEDQSNRLLNRARVIIRKSPTLQGHLKIQSKSIINTKSHASVTALAADVSSSEGLLSPWIVVDELARWKQTQAAKDMWVSIFSSHPKVPGARLIVLGHAGDPSHWSFKIRERARTSPKWRFVSVPGPTPWLDPDDLIEQQALLLPSQYAQRYLNIWTAGEDRLASRDDVLACVADYELLEPSRDRRYVTGLDLGLTNDRAVATICHRDDHTVVVDRQHVWQGSKSNPINLSVIEDWLKLAHREYGGPVIADPWQAAHLCQRLKAAGVTVETFTFSSQSVGRLAVTLFRLIKDHDLMLPNDDELIDELANARLRQTSPGVYRIDHDANAHDDRVISLALAAQRLVSRPSGTAHFGARAMTRANLQTEVDEQFRRVLARDQFNPWRRRSRSAA
jgi:phage terminase large subunit-like protein